MLNIKNPHSGKELSKKAVSIHVPFLGGGGAERGMTNLASEMATRGVDVDIVVNSPEESSYASDLHENVQVVDLGIRKHLLGVVALARYLQHRRPDVLITVQPPSHPVSLVARAISGVDVTCVASVQNYHSREYEVDDGPSLLRRIILTVFPIALRRMEHVFAVAGRVKDDLVKKFGVAADHIDVVYNPIAAPDIDERARESVQHPWFEEDVPVLLAVGRLEPQKNYSLLFRAFQNVYERRSVRLLVLGEGKERTRLEDLAEHLSIDEAIQMPGFVDNPFAYMRQADVYVMSSNWEGLPSVLIEALAVGGNIVATDCRSGPREILHGGAYGRLVPVGDDTALTDAILEALDDGRVVDQSSLQRRAQEFSPEAVSDRYIDLLNLRPPTSSD